MIKLITVKEAAEISAYHIVYIRTLPRTDEIEAHKIAPIWRVDQESLEAYLKRSNT